MSGVTFWIENDDPSSRIVWQKLVPSLFPPRTFSISGTAVPAGEVSARCVSETVRPGTVGRREE